MMNREGFQSKLFSVINVTLMNILGIPARNENLNMKIFFM